MPPAIVAIFALCFFFVAAWLVVIIYDGVGRIAERRNRKRLKSGRMKDRQAEESSWNN